MTGDDGDHDDALDPADEALLREAARAPFREPEVKEPSVVGRRLGKYEVVEVLGRGGMGVVYVARDTALDRRVALKVMSSRALGDDERRRRALREAKSAAAVTGANIAAIYDVGVEADFTWFAMELVSGRTLRARLAEGPVDVAEALRISRGIARGLSRAHEVGIIHRDLKPDNVMLDAHGEPKVLDFGLAKRDLEVDDPTASTELHTGEGRLLGTPAYMSPEQAKGHAVTPRSDVFSLGTLLYEMLAGTRPFTGSTTMETLIAIDRDEPSAPSTRNPRVPPEVDALVARCLAKQAALRPHSAELEPELAALITLAERGDRGERGAASRTSNPGAAMLSQIEPTPSGMTGAATAPAVRSSPRRARAVTIAGVVALLGIGIGIATLGARSRSSTAVPAPASSVPAALDAYRAAVAARRDGSKTSAVLLERAVALDPELAVAHLDLAIYRLGNNPLNESGREHLRYALAHTERLTPTERELAHAYEPLGLRNPADWNETYRRLVAIKERYPNDIAVLRRWAAMTAMLDSQKAADAWALVVAADPDALGPKGPYGEALSYAARYDEARAVLDGCIARSSQSSSCLWYRIKLARYAGECVRMEELSRQLMVVEPTWDVGYAQLAESLAGRQPAFAIRAVLAQRWPKIGADERATMQATDTSNADAFEGDLPAALERAREAKALIEGSPLRRVHAQAVRREALLLLELGRTSEARAAAKEFLDRRQAWEPDTLVEDDRLAQDGTPTLLAIAALPDMPASYIRDRDAWEEVAHREVGGFRAHVWLNSRAYPAWILGTPAAAEDAIAALPKVGAPPTFMPESLGDLPVGAVYLNSNRASEAMPWLERAAKSCRALGYPVEHVRALDLLGQANESKRDVPAACAAYQKVLDRWGRAASSVTAAHARARVQALGCEKK